MPPTVCGHTGVRDRFGHTPSSAFRKRPLIQQVLTCSRCRSECCVKSLANSVNQLPILKSDNPNIPAESDHAALATRMIAGPSQSTLLDQSPRRYIFVLERL